MTSSDQERADNDIMLMTGELAKLLADLVEALGGEAELDEAAADGQHQISDGTAQDAARRLHQMAVREGASVTLTHGDKSVTFGAPALQEAGELADDLLYEKALAIVRQHQRVSISLIQRHLAIGYNRAARLIEEMEAKGVVSPAASNGNRTLV